MPGSKCQRIDYRIGKRQRQDVIGHEFHSKNEQRETIVKLQKALKINKNSTTHFLQYNGSLSMNSTS
jgi:hypothetical protein